MAPVFLFLVELSDDEHAIREALHRDRTLIELHALGFEFRDLTLELGDVIITITALRPDVLRVTATPPGVVGDRAGVVHEEGERLLLVDADDFVVVTKESSGERFVSNRAPQRIRTLLVDGRFDREVEEGETDDAHDRSRDEIEPDGELSFSGCIVLLR